MQFDEKAMLFDKSYTCPVCEQNFTSKTVRTGKVHMLYSDYDLRPVYDTVDQVKYEVIVCPHCGYAALIRYYEESMSVKRANMIREAVSSRYKPIVWGTDLYTYEEAKLRYRLAMANAIAKGAKISEKAYLYLKNAWLIAGETESLKKQESVDEVKIAANDKAEKEMRGFALDGFLQARASENYPIAGMDEKTLEYLLAALCIDQGRYSDCTRFLSNILMSKNITSNLRKRTQGLKEKLEEATGGKMVD